MTQYLGIYTAYGAVAVLAWLVSLLYPRLIPASATYSVDNRWQQVGMFMLAVALSIGVARLQRHGWHFPGDSPLSSALNRMILLAPLLVFIASRRSRAAVMIPEKHTLRSLAIGLVFALFGLAGYFLSTTTGDDPLALADAVQAEAAIEIAVRTALNCLVAAMFLALMAGGWSTKTALALVALAISATQIPGLLQNGFSVTWLGLLFAHIVLVVGLLSATLATRNIVWLWPVLVVLNLLQLSLG